MKLNKEEKELFEEVMRLIDKDKFNELDEDLLVKYVKLQLIVNEIRRDLGIQEEEKPGGQVYVF